MAAGKINIGANAKALKTRARRRSKPKARRHSKSLGPKDPMRRDRGSH